MVIHFLIMWNRFIVKFQILVTFNKLEIITFMSINLNIHPEPHIKESNYIRDFVFGFGDGVNTSLWIVAGVGGAVITADVVILAAFIGMFTGAKAMAVQNYLAVKSQREY